MGLGLGWGFEVVGCRVYKFIGGLGLVPVFM